MEAAVLLSHAENQPLDPFDHAALAETVALFGSADDAARLLATAPAYQVPPTAAMLRRVEGRLALARGDADAARRALQAAHKAFSDLGLRWETARTATLLAQVSPASEAAALRRTARDIFASLGDRVSLAELDAVVSALASSLSPRASPRS